ncbi:MAG: hypothetical protein WCY18_05285 [Methanofastidiosum sp.]
MAVSLGIDSVVFHKEVLSRNGFDKKIFLSMIGCAIVTEDLTNLKKAYYSGLKNAFKKHDLELYRDIISSNEILQITDGSTSIHEDIFTSVLPYISGINIIYTIFNSNRILNNRIKIYGKRKEIQSVDIIDFYNQHLANSFPHICLWKLYPYIYGKKANVYIDHFQSELTNAWEDISVYPNIFCYYNGDMTNVLISLADIVCKIVSHRLYEKNLFLRSDNLINIFPDLEEQQLFTHYIGNKDLPKITNIHEKKIELHKFIKRPVFYLYPGRDNKIDKKSILNSIPKFINFVHKRDGCFKFYTPQDIQMIKDNDYLVSLDSKNKEDIITLKELIYGQMNKRIHSCSIEDLTK